VKNSKKKFLRCIPYMMESGGQHTVELIIDEKGKWGFLRNPSRDSKG
jgi:hypothetical protein